MCVNGRPTTDEPGDRASGSYLDKIPYLFDQCGLRKRESVKFRVFVSETRSGTIFEEQIGIAGNCCETIVGYGIDVEILHGGSLTGV